MQKSFPSSKLPRKHIYITSYGISNWWKNLSTNHRKQKIVKHIGTEKWRNHWRVKMLHNKFDVVLIDKASGNVAFVCQRQHVQVLVNEFWIMSFESSFD